MTTEFPHELSSSFEVKINLSGPYAELTFNGAVSKATLNDSFLHLIAHPEFKYNMNACCDYCNAYPEAEMADIEEHAQFVAKNLIKRGFNYKLALVANDTLNRALLAVYKLLISKTSVDVEVFSSKEKAVLWLMSKD